MSIDFIFKRDFKKHGTRSKLRVKFSLLVHCSCDGKYEVAESISGKEIDSGSCTRSSVCPHCNDASILRYVPVGNGSYSVRIKDSYVNLQRTA